MMASIAGFSHCEIINGASVAEFPAKAGRTDGFRWSALSGWICSRTPSR
jgi:hypothetical protein